MDKLFQDELNYLNETLAYIEQRLEYLLQNNERRENESRELMREAYAEGLELKEEDGNGHFDSSMVQNELRQQAEVISAQKVETVELQNLYKRPYFAHIDFKFENEDEAEPIYIGLKDIIDLDNFQQYSVDWRAPIADLYYNYKELGPVSFMSKDQEIKGELVAKYQLLIEKAKLINVLDTSEQINDEVLQIALSKMGSATMKNIVETIQAEQNKIIRAEPNRTLIVQGVAGSGKTSIALHRAAYLIYLMANIEAADMLLISPSISFANYIASVLPSLGERNISYATLESIEQLEISDVNSRFSDYNFIPSSREKMEVFSKFEIVDYIYEFTDFLESAIFSPKAIELDKEEYVKQSTIDNLFRQNYKFLPVFARNNSILQHVEDIIGNKDLFNEKKDEIQKQINSMYVLDNLSNIYSVFAKWLESEKQIDSTCFDPSKMDEIDLSILALLKILLYGASDSDWVKHVIVDEMQDLLPTDHETIRLLFTCPRTILGDENQAVRYELDKNYLEQLEELYSRDKLRVESFTLNKSYRSTAQITNFARNIIESDTILALSRDGKEVEVVEVKEATQAQAEQKRDELIYKDLLKLRDEEYNTVAVIAKDKQELNKFKRNLKDIMAADTANKDILLNSFLREEAEFAATLCDIAGSKGIEFDAVILLNASDKQYNSELDRTKLYVACTRPLHNLKLYAIGDKSRFIRK